jgi:hypothetical protein
MKRSGKSILAAVCLFFTAPLVAEFLLGDLSLKLLPALIVLAPMYGGGALLIRELVRRSGRGWPSIFLLGAAYTLVEEAFVDQSLFNPNFLGLHLAAIAWIPGLGIGAWWTLFMFNLHTFWSIGVSIALVEALVPARGTSPWLGKIGDAIVGVLLVFGAIAIARYTVAKDPFVASHAQFLCAGCICVLLIFCAFMIPRPSPRADAGAVPIPWLTGAVALVLGMAVLIIPPTWKWGAFSAMLGVDVVFLGFLAMLSKRTQWTPLHTQSLAAGGALAYGVHAFFKPPFAGGGGPLLGHIGNAIFLGVAVALIAVGAKRTSRSLRA